jgi:phosphoserine phosphatase RsbU/P
MQATTMQSKLRDQLGDRRERLEGAISDLGGAADLVRLLREVDSALRRLDSGNLGGCLVCRGEVDEELLLRNPLSQYCLCDLSREQQLALQHDLDLASHVQLALLPKQNLQFDGWQAHFRYLPAGPVSGVYCDLVTRANDDLFFLIGDVSGKGVAASLFMARLNALFRSLIETAPPIAEMVQKADRLLAESTLPSHYATLVCGRASRSGHVEFCNAGHCTPLLVRGDSVAPIGSTNFPLGLFGSEPYRADSVELIPGDALFLFTDGAVEARDSRDEEYGTERLLRLLRQNSGLPPQELAAACVRDVDSFAAGAPLADDLTILVVRKN